MTDDEPSNVETDDASDTSDAGDDRDDGASEGDDAPSTDPRRTDGRDGTRRRNTDAEDPNADAENLTGDDAPPADTDAHGDASDEEATTSRDSEASGQRDAATGNGTGGETHTDEDDAVEENGTAESSVPADVRRYERFKKMDGATYERANGFLRDRTYITAREWAIARLCTDFRTETGVEMTKIGKNLPRLVPFMTDTYTPQAVNQARASFENKIRKAGATFLYGAMTDLFTAEELDDVMYEATEVAKFLLEVEGADLAVDAELAAEDRIQSVMREVHRQSAALRHDDVTCPHCGHEFEPAAETSTGDDAPPE